MRPKPILYVVFAALAIAAFAVPLLLHRMPLPLRFLAGFSNLLAAFAVAMFIRQARISAHLSSPRRRAKSESETGP